MHDAIRVHPRPLSENCPRATDPSQCRPPTTGSWPNATQSVGGRLPWLHFDAFNALFDAHVEHNLKQERHRERIGEDEADMWLRRVRLMQIVRVDASRSMIDGDGKGDGAC
jgi:hypothetical protein